MAAAADTVVDLAVGASMPASRVVGFARLLREHDFLIGPSEVHDALGALCGPDLLDPRQVRHALRTAFASSKQEWQRFPELFDAYWLGHTAQKVRAGGSGHMHRPLAPPDEGAATRGPRGALAERLFRDENAAADGLGEAPGDGRREGASAIESLAGTDVRLLADPADLERLGALAERLARRIRLRLMRRNRAANRARRISIRRTMRKSVATGGVPIDLAFERRRLKPLKLVFLLDVSGSMDLYSRFFMRFAHGLLGAFREAEAFIFHTRLVHISAALLERDPIRLMERMALIAQGWSGGTRIGGSLAAFNRDHAARVMSPRSIVMIVSDGYDTGDPKLLAREMAALRRRARRIVWINPLLGWPGYEPTGAGMAAALPHVDRFLPGHNLASLAALEPELARL